MGLTLLSGPANAGKVARLLDGYRSSLRDDAVLIVPNRSDVERAQRELLTLERAFIGGTVGTWDDVFERVARGGERPRPLLSEAQRELALRRAVDRTALDGLSRSAASGGFTEMLGETIRELEAALVEPGELEGPLAALYGAYREELDALGAWDRGLMRASAVERLSSDLDAWHGEPVYAYGFEDLTSAEWALLEALAGRTDVTVSLPYEPGRAVFESLRPTAERLGALSAGRIEELPPGYGEVAHEAIAFLERSLFGEAHPAGAPPLEGAIRFLEGAGPRGTLELVADEVLSLVRSGTPPERIGVFCPSVERARAPVDTVFGSLGVRYSLEVPVLVPQTAYGHALLALLRFAWLGGGRSALFAFLRTPYSGLTRQGVDFVEGRLRGRAIAHPTRVEEEMEALRGARVPALDTLRAAESPLAGVHELARSMLRAAYGLERPPVGEDARDDLRSYEACSRVLRELEGWEALDGSITAEDVVTALERATVSPPQAGEPGRVAVVDFMRGRTRHFDVAFVLGLEEGVLPRRGQPTPFLDDDTRARLGRRLQRIDPVGRDRYLFYTACTRARHRLYLVREAATDEGAPREPSPFWDEVMGLFPRDEVERWTHRRPLSRATWPLERAPSERERLRALVALASDEARAAEADALARANGWERRIERARTAFARPTRLRNPAALEHFGMRTTFNATELERFADCSSAWFVERVLDPRRIDAEVDAKLRGSLAHTALHRFFAGLAREVGTDRVEPERVEDAVRFVRQCLDDALEGVRMDMSELQRRELREGLLRDLENFVRDEAERDQRLVPRQFEVSFGTERSAPELQRGLPLGDGLMVAGKIDRIDVDPFSARGIVQDYKAGKGAHSARDIERELRLQIPLYMLVLRDLVGLEPLGGVYRPLAGARKPRGLLRADAREDALPGFARSDYLDEGAFWAQVDSARDLARGLAERIRAGDVRHDPKGGECPSWCDLWPMCRVSRA